MASKIGTYPEVTLREARHLRDQAHALLRKGVNPIRERITEELVPVLREAPVRALPTHEVALEVSDDAEKFWLYYPSAVENTDAYLRPGVLIEFGGRNATLPQDTMTIVPEPRLCRAANNG
jgi:hypothetical protein